MSRYLKSSHLGEAMFGPVDSKRRVRRVCGGLTSLPLVLFLLTTSAWGRPVFPLSGLPLAEESSDEVVGDPEEVDLLFLQLRGGEKDPDGASEPAGPDLSLPLPSGNWAERPEPSQRQLARDRERNTSASDSTPGIAADVALLGGITLAYSLVHPNVRPGMLEEGSIGEVVANFRRPIRRALEGKAEDTDSFWTNNVAHPLSWAVVGMYLKERGYSSSSALLLSQLHSITWEYIIEGSYKKPSGRDLVANLAGSSLAILAVYELSERAARTSDKRLHHHILAALNPLRPLGGLLGLPGEDPQVGLAAMVSPRSVDLGLRIQL